MAFDLTDVTPIRTMPKLIEARCFNSVRLALRRFKDPCEIPLPGLRVRVILERKQWVVCSLINDFPLMAWVDFASRGRGLHEPVACRLHLYHFHAGLLMGRIPAALEQALGDRFGAAILGEGPPIPWPGHRY